MQVYDDLKKIKKDENTIVSLGTFDGVHLGHKKIIDKVVERTAANGGRNFLITFHPHPRTIVSDSFNLKLLTTTREKIKEFEKLGVENLFIINFTKEFSQLAPEQFFKNFVVDAIGLREVVIGYDHHFGKSRGGGAQTLYKMGSELGFKVTVADPLTIDDHTVSSTKIRNALMEGNINKASALLGRYYSFSGSVTDGDKRGRELGFPTANINLEDQSKLLPAIGIYVVEVIVDDQKHFGLLSIGKRPTFHNSGEIVPEVFIYDFNQDIYNKFITVNIVERLRGEEKYTSAEDLVNQMLKDKENGLIILSKLNN